MAEGGFDLMPKENQTEGLNPSGSLVSPEKDETIGKIIFTDNIETKKKAITKPKETRKLEKGDAFENTDTGERAVVERTTGHGEDRVISYIEKDHHGVLKHEKQVMQKSPKSFEVLVGTKGMEKIDPIKEKYPEFYEKYGEEMTKAEDVFVREFEANSAMMEAWEESIEEEYGPYLRDELLSPEKKKEGTDMMSKFTLVREKIEVIGNTWNALDERFVVSGRKKIRLLSEIRSLEAIIPKNVSDSKKELILELEKEQGAEEPNVELIEQGYCFILLDRKVEALQAKYDSARAGKVALAEDAPTRTGFVQQVDALFASIDKKSPPKEIKKILDELDALEKRVFVQKSVEINNSVDANGRQRGRKGKQVKKFHEGGIDEKKKKTRKKSSKSEWEESESSVAIPVISHDVESNGSAPLVTPSVVDNTSNMNKNEIIAQENPKKQEFLNAFSKTCEDLKLKISTAENIGALKGLKRGGRDENYKFFDMDIFAGYLNNLQGVRAEKDRKEAFSAIVSAEKELEALYRSRMDELKEIKAKRTGEKNSTKKDVVEKENEKELSDEETVVMLAKTLARRKHPFNNRESGKTLEIIDISEKKIKYKFGEMPPLFVEPKNVQKFLDFMEENFGWVFKGRKISQPPKPEKPTPTPEQPKLTDRSYEELAKELKTIKKNQCVSIVAEGLAPLTLYAEKEKVSLQNVIEQLGAQKVAQGIVASLEKILPSEWSDQEKSRFAVPFIEGQIKESLD